MNTRLTLLGLIALLALAGCGDSRGARKEAQPPPWPEQGAPDALHSLSEDLLAYQATLGRLPKDMLQLDRSGLITGGPYATKGYVYHPSGIGVLRDGWRVVAADDRIREQDRVWCVVRPPVRISGTPGLRVVLVPMPELRQAASAAGGGI